MDLRQLEQQFHDDEHKRGRASHIFGVVVTSLLALTLVMVLIGAAVLAWDFMIDSFKAL